MKKALRKASGATLSLLLLASPVCAALPNSLIFAEEMADSTIHTFDGTADTRVDISDQLPANDTEYNTMVWSGKFKLNSTSSGIMSLLSISTDAVNSYMTLYVNPTTGRVGYEFRQASGSNKSNYASYTFDTEEHSFELTASTSGYVLKIDGEELLNIEDSSALLPNNAGYTSMVMTMGGMNRPGKTEAKDNWYFDGQLSEISVRFSKENEDPKPEDTHQFNGTMTTRLDVSDHLPADDSDVDTMIWSGTFQCANASSGIMTLVSLGGAHVDDYLTLYVTPSSNRIGFQFRRSSSNSKESHYYSDETAIGTSEHTFTLTASYRGYTLVLDGQTVIDEKDSSALSAMNCGYATKGLYLGGMNRTGKTDNASNWYFNGEMSNVSFTYEKRNLNPTAFYEVTGVSSAADDPQSKTVDLPASVLNASALSMAVTYRAAKGVSDWMPVASLSAENGDPRVTLEAKENALKLVLTQNGQSAERVFEYDDNTLFSGGYHTAVLVPSVEGLSVYVDGEAAKTSSDAFSIASLGRLTLASNGERALHGDVTSVKFYDHELSAYEAANVTEFTTGMLPKSGYRTSILSLAQPGEYNSGYYRIPALVRSEKGTMIMAADKRNDTQNDMYNIDTLVRRRVNGEWQEGQVAIDMPDIEGTGSSQKDSNTIDAELLSAVMPDGSNRIFMLVDFIPQNTACMMYGHPDIKKGSGYVEVDGKRYLKLVSEDGQDVYTVRDNGHIFNSDGEDTGATMKLDSTAEIGHRDFGRLTGPNGEDWGSCWMYTGEDKGHLQANLNTHLILTYSDDDGATWSAPNLITDQVKEDWMVFLGTGPGRGIQLKNGEHAGRLVFSAYSWSNNVNSQSSTSIYSDDYGVTWHRAISPLETAGFDITQEAGIGSGNYLTENQIVELNSGKLLMFCRNNSGRVKVSESTDGGATWSAPVQTSVADVYCQVAATHTNFNGKEYVLLSNPQGPGRTNGAISVAEVNDDDSLTWIATKQYWNGSTQYSCLEEVEDGVIALVYEADDEAGALAMRYAEFSMEYLIDEDGPSATVPQKSGMTVSTVQANEDRITAGDSFLITVNVNQAVFVNGEPTMMIDYKPSNPFAQTEKRMAEYVSGNGTDQMVFRYTVTEEDRGGTLEVEHIIRSVDGVPAASYYDVEMYTRRTTYLGTVGALDGGDWSDASRDIPNIEAIDGGISSWGDVANATDGDESTFWHSSGQSDAWLLIDLKSVQGISGLRYLPRPTGSSNGDILEYEISVGVDADCLRVIKTGTWELAKEWHGTSFMPVQARYVKIRAIRGNAGFGSAAEIRVQAAAENETALYFDHLLHVMEKAEALLGSDDLASYDLSSLQDEQLAAALSRGQAALDAMDSQGDIDTAANAINLLLLEMRLQPGKAKLDSLD